jgi:hypothetical protein
MVRQVLPVTPSQVREIQPSLQVNAAMVSGLCPCHFLVLQNPLKVAPETIMDLRVLQTIKDGVVVHDALE